LSDKIICDICNDVIKNIKTALARGIDGKPVHFECALEEVQKQEQITDAEKICYLGKGSFGIVQMRNPNSPIRFFVRKRIQYEEEDNKPDWRKQAQKIPLK